MDNFMNSFSLKGKVALITGASYGIGFNIARGFAAAGATIVFNDINQELVDRGLASYKEEGIDAHGYVCDVTDENAVNELVKKQGLCEKTTGNAFPVFQALPEIPPYCRSYRPAAYYL